MSEYTATVHWNRNGAPFLDKRFSREHTWTFDGGLEVRASASPHVVRAPMSVEEAVDPEEAFVASLASCHMLTFLFVAASRGFVIDSYSDEAAGTLAKDAAGKLAMTRVILRPRVTFSGDRRPSPDERDTLHHEAHEGCFIAQSVKTDVTWEPVDAE